MNGRMTIVRYVALLFLITLLGQAQVAQKSERVEASRQAEITVRRFYQQLVSDPVGGIPTPREMKVLSPYLSGLLIHRIEQTRACKDDWFRQHPTNDVKVPSDWFEFGLFSGADDRGYPWAFRIDRVELKNDGSFRGYVRLTEGPREKPWNWEVAAIVIRENGRFVINDVIFLKDKDFDTESRLSELLARGCDGPRWVGDAAR